MTTTGEEVTTIDRSVAKDIASMVEDLAAAAPVEVPAESPETTEAAGADRRFRLTQVLRAMATAKSRIQELELTAQMERDEIARVLAADTEHDRRLIVDLEIQAKAIAEEHLAALKANPRDGDTKGVRTRFGRVDVTEYEKPAITQDDPEAFAGWCETHDFMRPVPKPDPVPDWKGVLEAGKVVNGVFTVAVAGGVPVVVDGVKVEKRPTSIKVIV
jgi:hypothetical protein